MSNEDYKMCHKSLHEMIETGTENLGSFDCQKIF